ncbi:MAG: hypothetical protein ACPG31_09180 [Planctomycetota bacterium]
MIRFLLPVLLIALGALGACQVPGHNDCSGADCGDCAVEASMDGGCCSDAGDCADAKDCGDCDKATQASMMMSGDCDGGSCEGMSKEECETACAMKAAGICDEKGGECPMEAAGNDVTQVRLMGMGEGECQGADESCAMKAAGVCEGESKEDCPMEAAGNETCSKAGAGATQVVLGEQGACATKSECSSEAKAECSSEAKAECSSEAKAECNGEAPAAEAGATQVILTEKGECSSEAKAECSSEAKAECSSEAKAECPSKKADPSS